MGVTNRSVRCLFQKTEQSTGESPHDLANPKHRFPRKQFLPRLLQLVTPSTIFLLKTKSGNARLNPTSAGCFQPEHALCVQAESRSDSRVWAQQLDNEKRMRPFNPQDVNRRCELEKLKTVHIQKLRTEFVGI